MRRAIPILLLALLMACARGTPAGFDTVTPDYTAGGGGWSGGAGITVAVRTLERGGRTLVCGAWTVEPQSVVTLPYNSDVIEVASIYLDGERLVQNLAFMTRVPERGRLIGAEARCVASPVAWRPAFAAATPRVRIPRFVIGGEIDDELGGGSGLIFRETPKPAL